MGSLTLVLMLIRQSSLKVRSKIISATRAKHYTFAPIYSSFAPINEAKVPDRPKVSVLSDVDLLFVLHRRHCKRSTVICFYTVPSLTSTLIATPASPERILFDARVQTFCIRPTNRFESVNQSRQLTTSDRRVSFANIFDDEFVLVVYFVVIK